MQTLPLQGLKSLNLFDLREHEKVQLWKLKNCHLMETRIFPLLCFHPRSLSQTYTSPRNSFLPTESQESSTHYIVFPKYHMARPHLSPFISLALNKTCAQGISSQHRIDTPPSGESCSRQRWEECSHGLFWALLGALRPAP